MTQLIMFSDEDVFQELKVQVLVITTICSLFLGPVAKSFEDISFKKNATSSGFGSSFSSGVYDHAEYCLPLKPRVNFEQIMKDQTSHKNKPKQYKINSKHDNSNLQPLDPSSKKVQLENQKQSYEYAFKSFPLKGKVLGMGEGGTEVEVRYLKVDDFKIANDFGQPLPNRKNHFVRLMCLDPKQQQECFIYFSMVRPQNLQEILKTCRDMQTKEHDWVQKKDNDGVASVFVKILSEDKASALQTDESFTFDVLGPSGNGEVVTVQSGGSSWGRRDGLGPTYQTEIYFPLSNGVIESMDPQGLVSLPPGSGVK